MIIIEDKHYNYDLYELSGVKKLLKQLWNS